MGLRGGYSLQPEAVAGSLQLVGLAATAQLHRWVEVGLSLRLGVAEGLLQFDAFAEARVHWRWRWLRLMAGIGLGISETRQLLG